MKLFLKGSYGKQAEFDTAGEQPSMRPGHRKQLWHKRGSRQSYHLEGRRL